MATTSMLRRLMLVVAVVTVGCGTTGNDSDSVGRHDHGGKDAYNASLVADNVIADVTIDPARVGRSTIHMEFSPPGGALQQVVAARGTLILRESSESIDLLFEKDGSNHFHFDTTLQTPGAWRLEFVASFEDGSQVSYGADVTIAP